MSALTAREKRSRVCCPACGGVGVLQEVRDGEGHEDVCWACQGEGSVAAFLATVSVGLDPGSALLDG